MRGITQALRGRRGRSSGSSRGWIRARRGARPAEPRPWRRLAALGLGLVLASACATRGGEVQREAPDESLSGNAGWGLGAFVANLGYVPVKLVYAAGGALAGGVTWAVLAGDSEGSRRAQDIMRPALSGDYVLTPEHLRGQLPIEFVGRAGEPYLDAELPAVAAGSPVPTCDDVPGFARVRFGVDGSRIGDRDQQDLQVVARTLQRCPRQRVRVEGHTDAQGDGDYNFDLSLRRAETVKAFLIGEGVDADRLEASGRGESQPVRSNATEQGRAANRRVELVLR